MDGQYGSYYNLADRIKDTYYEIDSDACVDLRKNDPVYAEMWQEVMGLIDNNKIIEQILEDDVAISLSAEEHKALVRYFELKNDMRFMERKFIYLRGHTDNFAYLKEIAGLKFG